MPIILILICLFATFKYHVRFNENRKFHELNYVNFNLSSNGKEIDNKFTGLKWITPQFKNNSNEEIILINQVKYHLQNDNRIKMLITNYSFFSAILNQKLFSPSRWHFLDGTAYPLKGNKYFVSYKNESFEYNGETVDKIVLILAFKTGRTQDATTDLKDQFIEVEAFNGSYESHKNRIDMAVSALDTGEGVKLTLPILINGHSYTVDKKKGRKTVKEIRYTNTLRLSRYGTVELTYTNVYKFEKETTAIEQPVVSKKAQEQSLAEFLGK